MKFYCDSRKLAYAVNKSLSITQDSRTFPYLKDVVLEAYSDIIKVSCTDHYTFSTYYVHADVDEHGTAIVDARSLAAFLNVKAGNLEVHTTEKNLIANLAGNRVMLRLYIGMYPEFPNLPKGNHVKIKGSALLRLLKVSAMADEDVLLNPKFSGTMLLFNDNNVHSMATNKFKLGYAWESLEFSGNVKFLVPPKTVSILDRFTDPADNIKIYYERDDNKRRLYFVSDYFTVSTVELAGEYPYEAILRMVGVEKQHSFTVDTMEIIEALRACKAITGKSQEIAAKTITIESDSSVKTAMIRTSENNEIGVMKLNVGIADIRGSDFIFNINSDFVDTAVSVIEKARRESEFVKDKIILALSEDTSFIYITSPGLTALFTISPIAAPKIKDIIKNETSLETAVTHSNF